MEIGFQESKYFDEHYERPFDKHYNNSRILRTRDSFTFIKCKLYYDSLFVHYSFALKLSFDFRARHSNLCLLLRPQMNVFMFIWCVLLCFEAMALPPTIYIYTVIQFFFLSPSRHHMLSHNRAANLPIQTLICHHSHSNFILCARFAFNERLYLLFFFFLSFFFYFVHPFFFSFLFFSLSSKEKFIHPVLGSCALSVFQCCLNIVYFSITFKHDNNKMP